MKISNKKKEKISEQILNYLYSIAPKLIFTSQIARELARDEEFVKKILINLKSKGLVFEVNKNPQGVKYLRRTRWKLSDKAYEFYNKNNSPI